MLNATQGFVYNKFQKPNDWPKLKDTFDYKIENGKLLSANEHIYLSGPVTYTKFGNPTIIDNVASNFSEDNYFTIDSTFPNNSDLEVLWKFTTGNSLSGTKTILSLNNYFSISIVDNYIRSYDWKASTWRNIVKGSINTIYWIKLKKVNTDLQFSYSTDGINFIDSISYTRTDTLQLKGTIVIGKSLSNSGRSFNGSMDFNSCYIKVNGNLWFYGKNYTTKNMVPVPAGLEYNNTTTPSIGWVNTNTNRVKGPVNYTVVGNPTIVNGVASGFSKNDFLRVTSQVSSSSFDIYISFKTGSNISGLQTLLENVIDQSNMTELFINEGRLVASIKINSNFIAVTSTGSFQLNTNTAYVAILKYNGSSYIYSIISSGVETIIWEVASNINVFGGSNRIGNNNQSSRTFRGSIDLNETYIKVNGQPWFGYCPSEFQQFTAAPQGTMIGKDETEMLQVETYQDKGTVDYTVVGSPTIVDGIVSGFSNNDYLSLPYIRQQQWEVSVAFLYIKSTDKYSTLYKSIGGDFGLYFRPNETRISVELVSSNFFLDENYSFIENHNYQVVIDQYNTNEHHYYIKDLTAGTIVSQGNTQTFNRSLYGEIRIGTSGTSYCISSIDLKETYIKVDGNYWFHPYPNSYPKLVGPVTYTTNGSPTIENGVVSNFTDSNNLTLDSNFKLNSKTVAEFNYAITTGSFTADSNAKCICGTPGSYGFQLIISPTTKKLRLYLGDGSSSSWNILNAKNSISELSENAKYFVKILINNQNIKLLSSTDKQNWIEEFDTNVTIPAEYTYTLYLGRGRQSNQQFVGSINLNETNIKVNNTLWFGKEDWKPSTYTDNAIYLLGSHKTDYSNYNELSFTPSIETESDEVGNYNVWIDNQKVIENKTGNTLIEWDKLALTTGYSVTTPSTLKAHSIKIEPINNTDIIIGYETNRIEDGPTPEPAIIDANTTALFHLDENSDNAISGSSITAGAFGSTIQTTRYKFGSGSSRLDNSIREGYKVFDITLPGTVDFWFRRAANGSSPWWFKMGVFTQSGQGTETFTFTPSDGDVVKICSSNSTGSTTSVYSQSMSNGDWHHIAFERDTGGIVRYYIDGQMVYSRTSSITSTVRFSMYNYNSAGPGIYVDEVRLSDIARYGGNNFVPPIEAYH